MQFYKAISAVPFIILGKIIIKCGSDFYFINFYLLFIDSVCCRYRVDQVVMLNNCGKPVSGVVTSTETKSISRKNICVLFLDFAVFIQDMIRERGTGKIVHFTDLHPPVTVRDVLISYVGAGRTTVLLHPYKVTPGSELNMMINSTNARQFLWISQPSVARVLYTCPVSQACISEKLLK